MSTVKSKKLQVGADATATNNFTIYQPSTPDGTLRIGVGNADSPTEVAQFTSAGMVSGATSLTTASGSAPSYSARAWVNFNGTGTVAIRASGNVSSITDLAVGNYSVNFTNNMVDSDFSAGLSVKLLSDSYNFAQVTCSEYRYPSSRGVGFIKVNCTAEAGGVLSVATDPEMYSVQIFR